MDICKELPDVLLPWYDAHKRDLPWRKTVQPYAVWLSEIMLQQTRVEAVKGYYARFLEALPTIEALANCDDDQLHKLWEGLGYYSRVRNLKKAARIICDHYGGRFPQEYDQVLALPGIGEYTAGAICSIAFNQPTPAVDGNVLRVISRLCNDDTPIDLPAHKAQVRSALQGIYPQRSGDFTQALMELGATLCGPNREPACECCPCSGFCRGYQMKTAAQLPIKSPPPGKKVQEMTVFVLSCDGKYALRKRPNKGLLAGLWQFPNVPGLLETDQALAALADMGLRPRQIFRQVRRQHIFTHIRWEMQGYYLEVAECAENYHWLTPDRIDAEAALPTAFRQFWEGERHV